jgi:hypothetical protein
MTKGKAKQAIAKVAAPAKKATIAEAAPKEVIKPAAPKVKLAVVAPAVAKPVEKAAAKASEKTAKKLPEKVAAKAPAKVFESNTTAPVDPVKSAESTKPENTAKPAKAEKSARALTGEGTPPAQAPAAPADAKLERKLASNPPRALNSPIRIFQIYFEPWQRELLDPAFYPLDNSRGTSELLEFAVFEQLQRNAVTEGASLWGALSWRFGEKAGIQGAEWVKQIVEHPGNDVYYCNPHPLNEALFHNMWLQGETAHPDFLTLSKSFFKAAGLDENELMSVQASGSYSAANYFVASPKFWQRYLAFVRKTLAAADKGMPAKERDLLHSRMADDRNLHGGATYLPFVVERLFPVFMRTEGKDLKAYKIALPERERELNVHLKLLREMKDVAHRTQSAWLATCWVNYRNLYLSQTNGKAWCEKYLRSITPTEVRFA